MAAAIPAVVVPEAEVEAERQARAVPVRVVVVRIAAVRVDARTVAVAVAVVVAAAITVAVAALAAGVGLVEDRLDHGARNAGAVEGDHVIRVHVEAALALMDEGDDLVLGDARLLHADDVVDDVRTAA